MGHVPGSTFGVSTATLLPQSGISWGFSPYAGQPFGGQSFPQHYGQPFSNQPGYGIGSTQSPQQVLQFLQLIPQQVQQLQILQQQLAQIQSLLQPVPAQLQQLQQMIQFIPQQIQLLQQQPYGASFSGAPNLGQTPQAFAGTGASYVM